MISYGNVLFWEYVDLLLSGYSAFLPRRTHSRLSEEILRKSTISPVKIISYRESDFDEYPVTSRTDHCESRFICYGCCGQTGVWQTGELCRHVKDRLSRSQEPQSSQLLQRWNGIMGGSLYVFVDWRSSGCWAFLFCCFRHFTGIDVHPDGAFCLWWSCCL